MMSSLTGLPALFVRKAPKAYGTRRLAEGADVDGRRITLVEDIVTTGGAARDATVVLREHGATVGVVVCTIDRSEPGANRLHEPGSRPGRCSPGPTSTRPGRPRAAEPRRRPSARPTAPRRGDRRGMPCRS